MTPASLKEILSGFVREGELYEKLENDWVLCYACGHRCKLPPGRDGICRVRFNDHGILRVPFGYVGGIAIDPIEKKPFFHVLPGSSALSFGMLGCDYHCGYCQNWITSQTLRDPDAAALPEEISAEGIVRLALERRVRVLTSTYNEPLITSEWARAVFQRAKEHGIKCSYVSNGNGTREVLEYIRPFIDMFKVDLKSFRQKTYQQLGGRLAAVLETIGTLHGMGVWVEVVTLLIQGFNDSDEELKEITRFLVSVSPDIPWHVTGFHPDYKMTDPDPTSVKTLARAAAIGHEAGLHFVYAGNLPGRVGTLENTYCPSCHILLIERTGYMICRNLLLDGRCPSCHTFVPGVWA